MIGNGNGKQSFHRAHTAVIKTFVLTMFLFTTLTGYTQNSLTVKASEPHQTLAGSGMNVNSYMMSQPGNFRRALRTLVNVNGANLFRVVHDRVSWVECQATTRPASILAKLEVLDHATLRDIYERPDMQDLWNTIGELNANGVVGEQIIVSFMGWIPKWMGGICGYGPNPVRDDAQTDRDYAIMIASLVYYGHRRKDISGTNSNLDFAYISPFNEPDLENASEGPLLPGEDRQMNVILGNIAEALNKMGDTSTKLVGPETAGDPDPYTQSWSTAVKSRTPHIAWHSYSDAAAQLSQDRHPSVADWMTETSQWCEGCDSGDAISGDDEWSFAAGTGDLMLGDIDNGFSAVLLWEAFDSYYHHHDSWSAWGHIAYDRRTSAYTMRKRGYVSAIVNRGLRPGMQVLELSGNDDGVVAVAVRHPSTGWFSLVGHNTTSSPQELSIRVKSMTLASSLLYYQTSKSKDLEKQADVLVSNGTFSITVPADTFFLVTSQDPPVSNSLRESAPSLGTNAVVR